MKPSSDDVQQMVGALMTLLGGLERARKSGDANTLAILQMVAIRQRIRPSEIARELGVHQSTITRQVRTLEEAQYISVLGDPEDRRSCFVELTSEGLAEIHRLTEVGLSRFAAFVADWEAEDVRTLGTLLDKLEKSKAKVNPREARPEGRKWQKASQPAGEDHAA